MGRATFATLSTENLLHNLSTIKKWAPKAQIMAMIKANGYGHGLRSVALRLAPHVDNFGVASIDEAVALRRAGITIAITSLSGVSEPDDLPIASQEKVHVVFHEKTQLQWLESYNLPSPLQAWVKIDTGLGRLGFTVEEGAEAHARLLTHKYIAQPCGIMSHFACADQLHHPLNQQQINVFQQFVHGRPGPKSLCNSAATFFFPDQHYDMVRTGIALYGISPIANYPASQMDLKPVMTLQTRLIAVRMTEKGSTLGYGAEFVCSERMPIGVIAMGYGDGYARNTPNGTPVLVNGIKCFIVGRVSMDLMTLDLRNYPTAKTGDWVTLWGNDLPIEEVAACTAQSPYDMVTSIQWRVKFRWTTPPAY